MNEDDVAAPKVEPDEEDKPGPFAEETDQPGTGEEGTPVEEINEPEGRENKAIGTGPNTGQA